MENLINEISSFLDLLIGYYHWSINHYGLILVGIVSIILVLCIILPTHVVYRMFLWCLYHCFYLIRDFLKILYTVSKIAIGRLFNLDFSKKYSKEQIVKDLARFDDMDTYLKGKGFEEYVRDILKNGGIDAYTTGELRDRRELPSIIMTQAGSGEQGVDVVAYLHINGKRRKIIIQCKHYGTAVSNGAVQEIFSALNMYKADYTMVITNNVFTQPATNLAKANSTLLVDINNFESFANNPTSFMENFYKAYKAHSA